MVDLVVALLDVAAVVEKDAAIRAKEKAIGKSKSKGILV